MNKLKQAKKFAKKATAFATVFGMAASLMPAMPVQVKAADFSGQLTEVKSVAVDSEDNNIVWVTFNNDVKGKITFLEDGIFRYNVDPSGEFSKYAAPRYSGNVARIQQYPDESEEYSHPDAAVTDDDSSFTVTSGDVSIVFDKGTAKMTVKDKDKTVMEEKEALTITANGTVQTLKKQDGENFYGGGTQNGRFVHTGEVIHIANESNWVDGGVASPNPFYYTLGGYGVLRNTFRDGSYDFGKTESDTVTAVHEENEFDAYYFITEPSDGRKVTQELLQGYYKVTGNPTLLPEFAFYLGHLNAYNRDSWSDESTSGSKGWTLKGTDAASSEGTTKYESGRASGYVLKSGMHAESLNGEGPQEATKGNFPDGVDTPYKYSARQVIDDYVKYDMPLGYFLPNDGYGSGYGQNGYYQTGGVNADGTSSAARTAAIDANVANLKSFADYADSKGVATGLWTQSYLTPDSNNNTYWHLLRDFRKEVAAGVSSLKTDVAWVGYGYSMQLDSVKSVYEVFTSVRDQRPNTISLDGWAGSQRYSSIWTGDQTGGDWEYIRFHIPTYIGTSLSGNPNVGSDMDGIFGGGELIATRDYQWKIFSQAMLNMDGWGTYAKMPFAFGDPYTGITRMYLKTKAKLLPYLYTAEYAAANIATGNDDIGLPMVRAMFLEYPDDEYAYTKNMQYQYMYGSNVLVAPIYQDTNADEIGNDVRDNIYLPDANTVWVDLFTGKQYQGGQILNNFDAPLWKLPAFVKNGSIIPQYEENDSPSEIDKSNRIVEFWPEGKTEYTAIEDDGIYAKNNPTEDSEYGIIDNVDFGEHVSTKYTSVVEEKTAREKYAQNDFNITMTNDLLPEDDGTNVSKLIQTNSYNGLFNGNIGRDFEFKWDVSTNHVDGKLPEYVSLPVTMHFELKNPGTMSKVVLHNANKANGYVTSVKAKAYYADGTTGSETITLKEYADNSTFEFKLNPNKVLKSVDVTPLTAIAANGAETSTLLTLAEIELFKGGKAGEMTATLTAEKSTGSYEGYSANKNTTFIVHVSKKPTGITASNGATALTATEAASKAAFDAAKPAAGTAVWFYDAAPEIETYATEEETAFKAMVANVEVAPKLYVKFASANAQTTEQKLVINGFENDGGFTPDTDTELAVPVLTENVEAKTPTSVTVNWTEVDGATSYELMIDGRLNSVDGDALSYTYTDLAYASDHTFQVRARNAEGVSAWSEEQIFTSDDDPWRNTPDPVNITWTGQIWGAHGPELAFDKVFQTGDGGFHSNNGGINEKLTVDYGKAYRIEKIEYYPRTDKGNGTVTKMKLEISLDGSHWTEMEYNWAADETTKIMEINSAARYIRFTALASVGTFFSASEIKVCTVEGDKGFAVGSTNLNQNVEEGDYTNMRNYLGTYTGDNNFLNQIQQRYGDINDNGYYDVYDYAFTMFQLDGGTQKKGTVGGASSVAASKEEIAAGESFTVAFQVQGASNVNALGQIITYDPSKVEYVSIESSDAISQMEDMCVNKIYDDGTAYVNIAFANRGDNALYSGDDTLVTLTMKAKEAISTSDTDVLNLLGLVLIGPDYSTNGEILENPEEIEKPDRKMELEEFDITMTNEKLPTDDGGNVNKLIQYAADYQGYGYAKLFDGAYGRDFEFLWDVDSNHDSDGNLPEYVTLPVTLHFALKEPTILSKLVVYNANKANGYATEASAKVNYTDGTSETKDIALTAAQQVDNSTFTFDDILTASKTVASVDVTIKKAITQGGNDVTNMLTLAEVEMFEGKPEEVKVEKYAQDDLNITITNDVLPTDDGSNVSKLIQTNSYDGLFDGIFGRDFELKWTVTDEITLPVTLHFAPKTEGTMSKLVVHNANKANGYVTQVGAKVNYADGTTEEKTIELTGEEQKDNASFTFEDIFKGNKSVESLDVTILKAIVGSTGKETTEMMTLAEIELFKGGNADGGSDPDVPDPEIGPNDPDPANPLPVGRKYAQKDFDLTITNDEMPTDSGNNVQTLIQQKSFDGLFDGSIGRDFELLWNVESNYDEETGAMPTYVKVPFTIHLDMKNPDTVSQISVYNANRANGYVTAIDAKVNYTDGTSTKNRIRKFDSTDYTQYPDNYAFTLKYDEAKAVESIDITVLRAIVGSTGAVTTNMVTLAEIEVFGALDQSELQDKYNQYKDTDNADNLYTTATWQVFQKALEDAAALLDSSDQNAIDKAIAALDKAFADLKTNREVLQAEYDKQAKITNNGVYTKESWDAFQKVLSDVEQLLGNSSAAGSDLEKALTDLQAAAGELVRIDRSNLLAELIKYESITNDDGTYTADSWKVFQDAVETARTVYNSQEASQQEIDNAAASLAPAFEKLVVVTEQVQDQIQKLESSVSNTNSTYTSESWNAYQAALTAVKEKLAQGASNEEISAAYAELQKAYQALQKADDSVQTPTPEPVPVVTLKKGDTATVGKVQYKVNNVAKKTVVAAKLTDKKATSVTIQATVKVNGVSCKVVQISASAFKGATKLQTVVIGKNVQTIGKNAFNGCTKLKKVTFKGTGVPTIKNGAFKKTKSNISVKVPKNMKKTNRTKLKNKLTSAGMSKKLKLS